MRATLKDLHRRIQYFVACVALFFPLAPAEAQTERVVPTEFGEFHAVPADEFLSSLGVCIHLAQGVSRASYIKPLKYLGIRNVRDDFGPPASYIALNRQTGVRANLIANTADLDRTLTALRRLAAAGTLLSIEGPNEPNNFPITYQGQVGGKFSRVPGGADWTAVAAFQRDLYSAIKSDPELASYPVFHVSEAGAQSPNVGLQFLTIPQDADTTFPGGTRFADYANVHNYVSSTNGQYVDNQAWNAADPTLNASWDGLYVEYGKLWGNGYVGYSNDRLINLPRVTTETGWDSKAGVGGERVQGTVLLNTYLAQFKRGWRYTFVYMLRDGEGGSGNQGIFNADSSPKLAATYIRNLASILADTSHSQPTKSLRFMLSNSPPTLHSLLLQKSSGAFDLIIWNERVVGTDRVTVKFMDKISGIEVFDPTIEAKSLRSIESDQIDLELTDHPIILEMSLKN